MMKPIRSWITPMAGVLFICAAGCANHIRNIETTANETERKVQKTRYHFDFSQDSPQDTVLSVTVEKQEQADVRNFEIQTVKSYSTPYSFWRELYEVPSGIGLLPVSLGTHMLFLFSIGMFPYEIPQSINQLSFTGLNPCLNWESESRQEEELVVANRKMLSDIQENKKTPLDQTSITVQAGDFTRNFETDEFGSFTVHFLSTNSSETFFPLARKISFSIASEPDKNLKDVILTREFLSRLLKARSKINAYKANPSGKKLLETVVELERMKFDQLAYALEESELAERASDERFQNDFKDGSQ